VAGETLRPATAWGDRSGKSAHRSWPPGVFWLPLGNGAVVSGAWVLMGAGYTADVPGPVPQQQRHSGIPGIWKEASKWGTMVHDGVDGEAKECVAKRR